MAAAKRSKKKAAKKKAARARKPAAKSRAKKVNTPAARRKAAKTQAARGVSMLAESERSAPSRRDNILANTANARIRGHALGSHRAAQAKRDAQQSRGRG